MEADIPDDKYLVYNYEIGMTGMRYGGEIPRRLRHVAAVRAEQEAHAHRQ